MKLRTALAPLQFSDSDKEHKADITKIFTRAVDRRYAWIMGTEAGPGAGNTSDLLVDVGEDKGYRMFVPSAHPNGAGKNTDCWIGVRDDLVLDNWETGYLPAIPGSRELYEKAGVKEEFPKWGPKGLVNVSFLSLPQLGTINLGAAHHLTLGRDNNKAAVVHGVNHYEWNEKLDQVITNWMRKVAAGPALAFAYMDRNASDRGPQKVDDATSLADELKKWQNSGHGDIDWMLSYNKDGRVKGVNFNVLDDKEFKLFGDHYLSEGVFQVDSLKTK